MRWTLETLSTWKCIENYWISSLHRSQCRNKEHRRAHRCIREWLGASRSTTYRDTSTGTIWSSIGTTGARTMWRRCRRYGKISACPIGTDLSLVSSGRWTQWAATQWPASAGSAVAVASPEPWLVSRDHAPSFVQPYPSNRFGRCSLCICDSCCSFHFLFWPQADRCDCHSRVLISPILRAHDADQPTNHNEK